MLDLGEENEAFENKPLHTPPLPAIFPCVRGFLCSARLPAPGLRAMQVEAAAAGPGAVTA
jgi:hypothetical protein